MTMDAELMYVVDESTGELVDVVVQERVGKGQFVIDDDAKAEWAMEKIQGMELEIERIRTRKKAMIENLDRMEANVEQRKRAFMNRMAPDLEKWARENMPKGKKTWTCPYGNLAVRIVPRHLKLVDKDLALTFAKAVSPNAVRVQEEVLVSLIPDHVKQDVIEHGPEMAGTCGFEIIEARETVTIKTLPADSGKKEQNG